MILHVEKYPLDLKKEITFIPMSITFIEAFDVISTSQAIYFNIIHKWFITFRI